MKKVLLKVFKESLLSILPMSILILIISLCSSAMDSEMIISYLVGVVFLIVGIFLYSLGAEIAIEPIGEHVGAKVSHLKSIFLILFLCFIIGFSITVAEPDLGVLASQVPSIDNWLLIFTVAFGTGILLLIAILRIFIKMPIKWILIFFYGMIFVFAFLVNENFIPLSFDAGGVTTGPITVPLILALGFGVSSVFSRGANDDSFGLVGICSIGPILAVLLLGLFLNPSLSTYDVSSSGLGIAELFIHNFSKYIKEVLIALSPIIILFILFQIFLLRLPKKKVINISFGILYTFIGLTFFLTGANTGFLPAGQALGQRLVEINEFIVVPIGLLVGALVVLAEPAVHILKKKVEFITDGIIKERTMLKMLMISVALAVSLNMIRVICNINILFFIIPGYLVSLILVFFVPKTFTAIAFDSGGVVAGAMTATFILPFSIGACIGVGGDVMTSGFGAVAMVAMTPLISIQLVGLAYQIRLRRIIQVENAEFASLLQTEGDIIELEV